MNAFECPLNLYARKQPQAPALMCGDSRWTYKECHEQVCKLSSFFQKIGIKEGDRVAIYPRNAFPVPLVFFALFRIGAIACPLNARLPLDVLERHLEAITPSLILTPDDVALSFPTYKTLSFSHLITQAKHSSTYTQVFLEKKLHATYLGTSGTTQSPKIAVHSIGNHYYSALGSNGVLPSLKEHGRYLLSLPLYHIAGIAILFRTFLSGATVVLPTRSSFEIQEVIAQRITHLSLVPTQLYRFLELPFKELESITTHLKCTLLGGDFIAPHLYHRGIEHGFNLYPTYGMTEMSSQITTATDPAATFFSLGHPLPYRQCTLAPDGEILVKGKTLFQGYLTRDKGLNLPLNADGYFTTHDLGKYSSHLGLTLLGRKDRLFISGGENIYPEEIERALIGLQGIFDARVTPTEDREFGMRPIAHICSKEPIEKDKLKELLKTQLPSYKIPIDFVSISPTKG